MRLNPMKSVLALVLVLAMVIVPMQVTATDGAVESTIATEAVAESTIATEVVADLSSLERPVELPEGYEFPEEAEFQPEADDDGYTVVDFIPEILPNDISEKGAGALSIDEAKVPATVSVGTPFTFVWFDNRNIRSVSTKAVAVGSNVNVWLADNADVKSNGKFTTAYANIIKNEFEGRIYSTVTGIVGQPGFNGWANVGVANPMTKKINIVLYDEAPDADGLITAGFFNPNDYRPNAASNNAPCMFMNVFEGLFNGYITDPSSFNGTMAHEFQHLINYSHLAQIAIDTRSKLFEETRAVWMNEGLSGFIDYSYQLAVDENDPDPVPADHHKYMLADAFAAGTGHIPTDAQWARAGVNVLANYGASAYMMINYKNGGGDPKALLDDKVYGYEGSIKSVATNYWKDSTKTFDDLFALYALNTGVSTPVSSVAAIKAGGYTPYASPAGYNEWVARVVAASGAGIAGVEVLNPSTTLTSGGRSYSYKVALANSVGTGKNAVNITVPSSGTAKYYIVTPFNLKNVNNPIDWINAPKIAAQLSPGLNKEIVVGTDNMFTVIAVNFATALNANITFTAETVKTVSVVSLVTNPAALTAGEPNQKATIGVTSDMIADGAAVTVELVKDADNAVVAGAVKNVTGNVITAGKATIQLDIAETVLAGKYKFKVSSDGATTMSPVVFVSMSINLDDPLKGATAVSAKLESVTLKFGGTATVGNGKVSITEVGGETYFYEAKAADISGLTGKLPIGEFISAGKERITLAYGQAYNVQVENEAFKDADGNLTGAKDLGSFTIEGEPTNPEVLPEAMKLNVGESRNLMVYFGTSQKYDNATLAIDNDKVASIDKETVTTSGDAVQVSGLAAGSMTITLGFSGAGEEGITKTVAVSVTDPNPTRTTSSGTRRSGGNRYEGSSKPDVSPNVGGTTTATTATDTVSEATATKLAKAALEKATKDGKTSAVVTMKNVKNVPLAALKAMAKEAKAKGIKLSLQVETTDAKGAVILRMSVNPADATKDLILRGSTVSSRAKAIKAKFAKFFSSAVTVLSLEHKGDFGAEVELSVKVEKDQKTDNLKFYTYNSEKNTFAEITGVKYTVTSSGEVVFTTKTSGDFVISDGALVKTVAKAADKTAAKTADKTVAEKATDKAAADKAAADKAAADKAAADKAVADKAAADKAAADKAAADKAAANKVVKKAK